MLTADIDTTRFNTVMESLHDALIGQGKDVSTLLRDEHKRLTRTIVNFTAPTPASGAKQTGELAVKKDLYSLISEAGPDLIDRVGSKYGLNNISAWSGNTHLIWDHLDPNGTQLAELHNEYRQRSSGRPYRFRKIREGEWRSRIVVEKGRREPYVKLVQSHVGRWKAKWAYGATQLGDRYPSWITRHFGYVANKSVIQFDLSSDNQFITFGGRGPNFRRDLFKIKGAMTFRARVIERRIKLIVSGYAKDVAQGIRIQTKAHKHSESTEAVD